ncbi:MAG: hypothetical protein CMJ49_02795 [Planctomycetaceae bacterium]|nr:hypothetical protein [Planctomycetaceae bacterium]
MNDIHSVDDEANYLHSAFWRAHPEYRRVPDRDRAEVWADRALDFGHAAVRDHHMALLREMCERYDFDGLELDWMRFGLHFRPGGEAAGREVLTAYTAEVRRLLDDHAKRRGHGIKLGARVPARPDTAWTLGMDAAAWAKEGLIDMLVVTPHFPTIDTDMPIELWKQLLDGTGVTLAAGLELMVWPWVDYPNPQTNSLETARGAAASVIERGADRVYLFNYMDSQTAMSDLANYPTLLREVGSLATLAGKHRRHIVTRADTWAPGDAPSCALPAKLGAGGDVAFRVHVGPRPAGRVMVVLGLIDGEGVSDVGLAVRNNGVVCGAGRGVDVDDPRPEFATFGFEVAGESVQGGYNIIEVHAERGCEIGWVEMDVGRG